MDKERRVSRPSRSLLFLCFMEGLSRKRGAKSQQPENTYEPSWPARFAHVVEHIAAQHEQSLGKTSSLSALADLSCFRSTASAVASRGEPEVRGGS